MSDVDRLLTEADRLAALTDDMSATFAKELSRVLVDLERELRRLAIQAQEGSTGALVRAVRAGHLRREIREALNRAGYSALAETSTTTALDRVVTQVLSLREAANLAAFTSRDATRILALKALATQDVLEQGTAVSQALWRTLAQGLFSGRPLAELLEDLEDALEIEQAEARTLYDTLINIFARQVEALKTSEEPETPYAYLGPLDEKTRPFCEERVGRVFTREEIDAMDNGQLPNVFLTGGGYNCRHSWIAVSKFSTLRNLVGSSARIPEVERRAA